MNCDLKEILFSNKTTQDIKLKLARLYIIGGIILLPSAPLINIDIKGVNTCNQLLSVLCLCSIQISLLRFALRFGIKVSFC